MENSADFKWPACVSGTMGETVFIGEEVWLYWGVVVPLVIWLGQSINFGESGTDPSLILIIFLSDKLSP